jgi:hypothetical protein
VPCKAKGESGSARVMQLSPDGLLCLVGTRSIRRQGGTAAPRRACKRVRQVERSLAQCSGGRAFGTATTANLFLSDRRIGARDLLQSLVALTQRGFELGFQAIGRGT